MTALHKKRPRKLRVHEDVHLYRRVARSPAMVSKFEDGAKEVEFDGVDAWSTRAI